MSSDVRQYRRTIPGIGSCGRTSPAASTGRPWPRQPQAGAWASPPAQPLSRPPRTSPRISGTNSWWPRTCCRLLCRCRRRNAPGSASFSPPSYATSTRIPTSSTAHSEARPLPTPPWMPWWWRRLIGSWLGTFRPREGLSTSSIALRAREPFSCTPQARRHRACDIRRTGLPLLGARHRVDDTVHLAVDSLHLLLQSVDPPGQRRDRLRQLSDRLLEPHERLEQPTPVGKLRRIGPGMPLRRVFPLSSPTCPFIDRRCHPPNRPLCSIARPSPH